MVLADGEEMVRYEGEVTFQVDRPNGRFCEPTLGLGCPVSHMTADAYRVLLDPRAIRTMNRSWPPNRAKAARRAITLGLRVVRVPPISVWVEITSAASDRVMRKPTGEVPPSGSWVLIYP